MLFQDRVDAGEKLAVLISDKLSEIDQKNTLVVSLLRGGIIVGQAIAKKLGTLNIPLVVTKITSSFNQEYGIGALCQDVIYINREEVFPTNKKRQINKLQIINAKAKNLKYRRIFQTSEIKYKQLLINKTIILVDDGVATDASIMAAHKFIKSCRPSKTILAVPTAPADFNTSVFDDYLIYYSNRNFSAVSQFYAYFPQMEEN